MNDNPEGKDTQGCADVQDAIALFTYGTLTNETIQQKLFGATIESHKAVLEGWEKRAASDGYLFVRPNPNTQIVGRLMLLTAAQKALADEWEDSTLYQLLPIQVTLHDEDSGTRSENAWVYTRHADTQSESVPNECIAKRSISEVIAEIEKMQQPQKSRRDPINKDDL